MILDMPLMCESPIRKPRQQGAGPGSISQPQPEPLQKAPLKAHARCASSFQLAFTFLKVVVVIFLLCQFTILGSFPVSTSPVALRAQLHGHSASELGLRGVRAPVGPAPAPARTRSLFFPSGSDAPVPFYEAQPHSILCEGHRRDWRVVPLYSSTNDMIDYLWEEILGGTRDTRRIFREEGCLLLEYVGRDEVQGWVSMHGSSADAQVWVGSPHLSVWSSLGVPGAPMRDPMSGSIVSFKEKMLMAHRKTLYYIKSSENCAETTVEAFARSNSEVLAMSEGEAVSEMALSFYHSHPREASYNQEWATGMSQTRVPLGTSTHRGFPASLQAFEMRYGDVLANNDQRTQDLCLITASDAGVPGSEEAITSAENVCLQHGLSCDIKGGKWGFMFSNLVRYYVEASVDSYALALQRCKFHLVPNGHAAETSRLMDSIVAGSVPIIRSTDDVKSGECSRANQYLFDLGFPGLVVKDWGDLEYAVRPYLTNPHAYHKLRARVMQWYQHVFVKYFRNKIFSSMARLASSKD